MNAAIQFVVSDRAVSRTEYVTPVQGLIFLTGGFLVLISLESIVVYSILNWKRHNQERQVKHWLNTT